MSPCYTQKNRQRSKSNPPCGSEVMGSVCSFVFTRGTKNILDEFFRARLLLEVNASPPISHPQKAHTRGPLPSTASPTSLQFCGCINTVGCNPANTFVYRAKPFSTKADNQGRWIRDFGADMVINGHPQELAMK